MNIKQILIDQLAKEQADYNEHLALVEVLRPHDGKPFHGRWLNKLPEGYKYTFKYGMHHVKVNEHDHLIGYSGAEAFSADALYKLDGPYGTGAHERIEKLTAILMDESKLKGVIERYTNVINAFNELKTAIDIVDGAFDVPAQYDIYRQAGINSSILSDIKYGKR